MKLKTLKNAELLKLQSISLLDKPQNNLNVFDNSKARLNDRKLNINKIVTNQTLNNNFNNIYLPNPKKRKKYIFGDFVSLVEKYNMLHRFALLKKGIQSTTKKFDIEIRRKYKSLKKYKIQNFNFNNHIKNIFDSVNFNFNYYERNYQGKLNAHKLFQQTRKYILLIALKRINLFIDFKKNKITKIQCIIKRYLFQKKFNIWKQNYINKIIIIQKYTRRLLIRKKYKVNLVSIVDFIKYNQKVKEYDKNLKKMIKKRNAIRIIETWWEQILEERKRKELEAQIKKMPKDCQKLYRQFIRLGKQTKNVKRDYKEFFQKKIGFVP